LHELARLQPKGRPTGVSRARLLGRASPPRSGTAWADNDDGSRAVYRGQRRQLESLLLFDPPAEEWIPRRVALDSSGRDLTFEARSFEQPRRLVIRQEGAVLKEVALGTDWTPVRAVPASRGRLLLEADGCTADPATGKRDFRCNGFQIRGLRLARVELYDVPRDPGQRRDLAHQRPRAARSLLHDLMAFNPRPVAAPASAPLDSELEASLRALGYLQ